MRRDCPVFSVIFKKFFNNHKKSVCTPSYFDCTSAAYIRFHEKYSFDDENFVKAAN